MSSKMLVIHFATVVSSLKYFTKRTENINQVAIDVNEDRLSILQDALPSGSGFDSCTTINVEKSSNHKLVFDTSFHHMDDNGYYDGWTEHKVTVTPRFDGSFDVHVSGRNKNDIKDYIAETFYNVLSEDFDLDYTT